jgi:hypothetical protein
MLLGLLITPTPEAGDRLPGPFAKAFDPPETRAEVMVNRRDGPAFAQLAMDLSLDHPEQFEDYLAGSTPNEELAYRAGRPLVAWTAALLSGGGERSLLAPALMLITVASLGGIVAGTALAATRLGRNATRSWVVIVLPGLVVSIFAPGGCEPLALALTLFGWVLWSCDRKTLRPVVLWSLAALARETSLVVPVALAIVSPGSLRRRACALVVPAGTYGAWLLVVRWRTGLFPGNAGGGRVSPFFQGLLDEAGGWTGAEWGALALIVGLGVVAWRVELQGARSVLVLHVVAASALGSLVWEQAIDFSRVFVIVQALGVLALLPRRPATTAVGDRAHLEVR